MNKIEIKILNPEAIEESKKMMVCSARLTQRGHKINNMNDFLNLYNKSYSNSTIKNMINLPHPTIQKFGVINIAIVGASRRFLAQITRHQNEVKFMSASLQYSDYSNNNNFCVPYEILEKGKTFVNKYIEECSKAMCEYENIIDDGINNDAAGYLAPQGLRNVLIISATPYQWKHMIKQRTCNRNTKETQYVMLRIWEELYKISQDFFSNCGPFCMFEKCLEGKMCCKNMIPKEYTPYDILKNNFPLLYNE